MHHCQMGSGLDDLRQDFDMQPLHSVAILPGLLLKFYCHCITKDLWTPPPPASHKADSPPDRSGNVPQNSRNNRKNEQPDSDWTRNIKQCRPETLRHFPNSFRRRDRKQEKTDFIGGEIDRRKCQGVAYQRGGGGQWNIGPHRHGNQGSQRELPQGDDERCKKSDGQSARHAAPIEVPQCWVGE